MFHVLNRAVARLTIFEKPDDYEAFPWVVEETWQIVSLPIFAMVVMPNHWHFVVRPDEDHHVAEVFQWGCRSWGSNRIARIYLLPSRPFLRVKISVG